jgi:hypothetical protein
LKKTEGTLNKLVESLDNKKIEGKEKEARLKELENIEK